MGRILLVEDDVVTSKIFARVFGQSGHEVEVAKNGLEAIELLEQGAFSVLVTDMMMPRLGGEELCELVRADERFRDLPILVTTGVVDPERLASVKMYPGVEIFPKPVDLAALLDRIDQLTPR